MNNQTLSLIVLFSLLSTVWSFNCPQDNGYFRHPTDHHKFYLCVNGREYEYLCPAGTVWNQAVHRCDFDDGPSVWPDETTTTEKRDENEVTRPTRGRHDDETEQTSTESIVEQTTEQTHTTTTTTEYMCDTVPGSHDASESSHSPDH